MSGARNAKILALRGKLSFGLIARRFGVSRNVVAGVMWRAAWPGEKRIRSPNSRRANKCGRGRHGGGRYAAKIISTGGKRAGSKKS